MTDFLRSLAVLGGIAVIWIACQVNLFWSLVAILVILGSSLWLWLASRAKKQSDHLYDEPPTITPIRGNPTPQRYNFERTFLDAPFFNLESRNYGKIKPRKRVRNIPIDRFLELQEKIDALSEQLSQVLERDSTSGTNAGKPETSQANTSFAANYPQTPSRSRGKRKPRKPKNIDFSTYDAVEPFEAKAKKPPFVRFRKSRAGDPWDSANHWGWKA